MGMKVWRRMQSKFCSLERKDELLLWDRCWVFTAGGHKCPPSPTPAPAKTKGWEPLPRVGGRAKTAVSHQPSHPH